MNYTTEIVKRILYSNPDFEKLANEEDPFHLCYSIGNNTVVLFNSVGGHAEAYLSPSVDEGTIQEACEFAIIAKEILSGLIQKQHQL